MRHRMTSSGSLQPAAFIALMLVGLATAYSSAADLDLSNYTLLQTYDLPVEDFEASAVTWNWDTDTLFVLGDEGDLLIEVNKTGSLLNTMTLSDFDDTEGITYVGEGKFVVLEERLQSVYLLTWSAGGTASRSDLPEVSLGEEIGNDGLEGIAYDRMTSAFVVVKEKEPQQVRTGTINFDAGTTTLRDLFTPSLGVADLAGVQTLSAVPSLIGSPDADNLLIFSQASEILLEVSRAGDVLSSFDFSPFTDNSEGVTIDDDGVIYVVGENPSLYVLQPTNGSLAPLFGDFDCDGDVDIDDLDQYNGNIGVDATGALAKLDLDGDGTVGANDFQQHYTDLVETSNGVNGTFVGDVNLDGSVDVLVDAFTLISNLNSAATSWSQGDFNADGVVDVIGDAFDLIANLGSSNSNQQ